MKTQECKTHFLPLEGKMIAFRNGTNPHNLLPWWKCDVHRGAQPIYLHWRTRTAEA